MRTIKFRGKRLHDGVWVYGQPLVVEERGVAMIVTFHEAYPSTLAKVTTSVGYETLGQFTGLTDKNGKEIYEGDILLYNGNRRAVEWKYGTFGLSMHENGFPFQAFYELPVPIVDSTVIGNIHNNLELLKGGK